MKILRIAFIFPVVAILTGCPAVNDAYSRYDRSVSRDIAIGADQSRGAYASYTAHLGPQPIVRLTNSPDFKQPVAEMKGITW